VKEMLDAMGHKITTTAILSNGILGRKLFWDKWTGDVRVETSSKANDFANINTLKGKAYENGVLVEDNKSQ
jgi:hypothetical protein